MASLYSLFSGKAAREGYLAAFDQGMISAANFLATILLARSAGLADLGVYGVGFTMLRLARSIQEGFVVQPVSVFGAPMEEDEFRRYVTSAGLIQIALACGSSLTVAVIGKYAIWLGNDVAGATLYTLWFSFLFWPLQEWLRRVLYTRGLIFGAVLNTAIANVVRLAIMGIWAYRGNLTGLKSLDAIAWGSLAGLIPGLWLTRRFWTRRPLKPLDTWKRNWKFGRWVLGSEIASWVAIEFYPVLTAGMISFSAAGAYRALQNLVAPIHLLLRATDTFLIPRASKQYHRGGRRAVNRALILTYLFAGVPILGLLGLAVLFPQELLRFLYGETYVPYSQGILLMALYYSLLYAYWPLQSAFKAVRLSRPIFIANLTAILVMFTFGLWLIQRWGVYGTIAGQALNALVINAILWSVWLWSKGTK